MARVNVSTKKRFYPPFFPKDALDQLSPDRVAVAWHRNLWEHPTPPGVFAYVAEDDQSGSEMVGILIAGPEVSQDSEYRGEIYVLYVLPQYHRQGVGRQLALAAVNRLIREQYPNLLIWVLEKNPSRAFYESLGGALVRARDMEFNGYTMPQVAYGWSDLPRLARLLQKETPNVSTIEGDLP